jgi:conjugal transfer/entry exclusion protein
MNKETNEEIKKQIKELQDSLAMLKLVDNTSKLEVQILQQRLDKLYDKIQKNEN